MHTDNVCTCTRIHTHTHTHAYAYIYIYIKLLKNEDRRPGGGEPSNAEHHYHQPPLLAPGSTLTAAVPGTGTQRPYPRATQT